ncbi:MAG: DUF3842 family protein [Clostridiaceae bacterium]|mgnify:CR=1 FL=1|nr:DUF3842 family protein [Clostridiaceae bacterium]
MILVVDSQGGGIGRAVIRSLKQHFPEIEIVAVGTNGVATSAMLKAGADQAATGENAVVVTAKKADVIIGPIGIVIADSLLGEITPKMALAIGQSNAKRILIPVNHCDNIIVGVPDLTLGKLVDNVILELKNLKD